MILFGFLNITLYTIQGDYYDDRAKTALNKLQCTRKHLTSSEYVEIYRDLLTAEIFDQMAVDLTHLLDLC